MNATRTAFVVQAILVDGYNQSTMFPATREGLTAANMLCLKWRCQKIASPEIHKNVIGFRVLRIRERN